MFSEDIRRYEDFALQQETLRINTQEELSALGIRLAGTSNELDIINQSKIFLQRISEVARESAKLRIEEIVTNALRYVFGESYSFKISMRTTNSRPEAEFRVVNKVDGTLREFTPMIGKGGGIIDVLAVSLKFAVLELLGYGGFVWLDEPFKQVSEHYVPNAGKLLNFMTESSGRQVILITHIPILSQMCNSCLNITQEDGQSSITRV